jgi:hypothetical protein
MMMIIIITITTITIIMMMIPDKHSRGTAKDGDSRNRRKILT